MPPKRTDKKGKNPKVDVEPDPPELGYNPGLAFLCEVLHEVGNNLEDEDGDIARLAVRVGACKDDEADKDRVIMDVSNFVNNLRNSDKTKAALIRDILEELQSGLQSSPERLRLFLHDMNSAEHSEKGFREFMKTMLRNLSDIGDHGRAQNTLHQIRGAARAAGHQVGTTPYSTKLLDLIKSKSDQATLEKEFGPIIQYLNDKHASDTAADNTEAAASGAVDGAGANIAPNRTQPDHRNVEGDKEDVRGGRGHSGAGDPDDRSPSNHRTRMGSGGHGQLGGPWFLVNYHNSDGCEHLMLSSVDSRKRRRVSDCDQGRPSPSKKQATGTLHNGELLKRGTAPGEEHLGQSGGRRLDKGAVDADVGDEVNGQATSNAEAQEGNDGTLNQSDYTDPQVDDQQEQSLQSQSLQQQPAPPAMRETDQDASSPGKRSGTSQESFATRGIPRLKLGGPRRGNCPAQDPEASTSNVPLMSGGLPTHQATAANITARQPASAPPTSTPAGAVAAPPRTGSIVRGSGLYSKYEEVDVETFEKKTMHLDQDPVGNERLMLTGKTRSASAAGMPGNTPGVTPTPGTTARQPAEKLPNAKKLKNETPGPQPKSREPPQVLFPHLLGYGTPTVHVSPTDASNARDGSQARQTPQMDAIQEEGQAIEDAVPRRGPRSGQNARPRAPRVNAASGTASRNPSNVLREEDGMGNVVRGRSESVHEVEDDESSDSDLDGGPRRRKQTFKKAGGKATNTAKGKPATNGRGKKKKGGKKAPKRKRPSDEPLDAVEAKQEALDEAWDTAGLSPPSRSAPQPDPASASAAVPASFSIHSDDGELAAEEEEEDDDDGEEAPPHPEPVADDLKLERFLNTQTRAGGHALAAKRTARRATDEEAARRRDSRARVAAMVRRSREGPWSSDEEVGDEEDAGQNDDDDDDEDEDEEEEEAIGGPSLADMELDLQWANEERLRAEVAELERQEGLMRKGRQGGEK